MVILYAAFLTDVQVKNVSGELMRRAQTEVARKDALFFVNTWLIAGIMVVCVVNTTLSSAQNFVRDVENGVSKDIMLTPMAKPKLVASYMLSNAIISFLITFAVFIVAQIYIVAAGGKIMSFINILYSIGIILLCVFSFSCMVGYLVTFLKSTTAFTAICTAVGVLIGFFAGIYLPMGMFPEALRNILNLLPFTAAAMLFRIPFMSDSTGAIFLNDTVQNSLITEYGLNVTAYGYTFPTWLCVVYLIAIGALFFMLSIFRISKKI